MFAYITSTVLLIIVFHLITKKYGIWAGITVAGLHVIANTVDFFVDGNLTLFRQGFYSILAFLLLVAYFKTNERLGL